MLRVILDSFLPREVCRKSRQRAEFVSSAPLFYDVASLTAEKNKQKTHASPPLRLLLLVESKDAALMNIGSAFGPRRFIVLYSTATPPAPPCISWPRTSCRGNRCTLLSRRPFYLLGTSSESYSVGGWRRLCSLRLGGVLSQVMRAGDSAFASKRVAPHTRTLGG